MLYYDILCNTTPIDASYKLLFDLIKIVVDIVVEYWLFIISYML